MRELGRCAIGGVQVLELGFDTGREPQMWGGGRSDEKRAKVQAGGHERMSPSKATDWRTDGVRVVKAGTLDANTAQTPGMSLACPVPLQVHAEAFCGR